MSPVAIIVRHNGYGTRAQLFDALVADRLVVARSPAPLLDACRVLVAEGVDPVTRVVMRHAGHDYDALRSTVGHVAKLTVKDTRSGKPVFAEHKPYDARKLHHVDPPINQIEERPTEGAP